MSHKSTSSEQACFVCTVPYCILYSLRWWITTAASETEFKQQMNKRIQSFCQLCDVCTLYTLLHQSPASFFARKLLNIIARRCTRWLFSFIFPVAFGPAQCAAKKWSTRSGIMSWINNDQIMIDISTLTLFHLYRTSSTVLRANNRGRPCMW